MQPHQSSLAFALDFGQRRWVVQTASEVGSLNYVEFRRRLDLIDASDVGIE